MLIEAVVFLAPLAKLWFSIGAWKKDMENRIVHQEKKTDEIKESVTALSGTLSRINDSLIVISTKMDLLLSGKIKQALENTKENGKE